MPIAESHSCFIFPECLQPTLWSLNRFEWCYTQPATPTLRLFCGLHAATTIEINGKSETPAIRWLRRTRIYGFNCKQKDTLHLNSTTFVSFAFESRLPMHVLEMKSYFMIFPLFARYSNQIIRRWPDNISRPHSTVCSLNGRTHRPKSSGDKCRYYFQIKSFYWITIYLCAANLEMVLISNEWLSRRGYLHKSSSIVCFWCYRIKSHL